jgi:hypothetical protein
MAAAPPPGGRVSVALLLAFGVRQGALDHTAPYPPDEIMAGATGWANAVSDEAERISQAVAAATASERFVHGLRRVRAKRGRA